MTTKFSLKERLLEVEDLLLYCVPRQRVIDINHIREMLLNDIGTHNNNIYEIL